MTTEEIVLCRVREEAADKSPQKPLKETAYRIYDIPDESRSNGAREALEELCETVRRGQGI